MRGCCSADCLADSGWVVAGLDLSLRMRPAASWMDQRASAG
jgi:hypothetical protein